MDAFEVLDKIIESARSVAREPGFSEEVARRRDAVPATIESESDLLRKCATLIAYSQNARSDLVSNMIETGAFEAAFADFEISRVVSLEPAEVLTAHWERIRCIRFKKKVESIIATAVAISNMKQSDFNAVDYLNGYPRSITTPDEIETFWKSFDSLRAQFRIAGMPYFNQLITLLHLLLDLGFDCLKPDLIVQKTGIATGMLPPEPKERDLRQLVRTIQEYSLSRQTRPGVVDFYLLVYGGQTWAMQFAHKPAPQIAGQLECAIARPSNDAAGTLYSAAKEWSCSYESGKMIIRSVQANDGPAILYLIECMDREDGAARRSQMDLEHLQRYVLCGEPRAEALLATVDGAIVGLAAFRMSASTFWTRLEVYLDDLFVLPTYRRQRVGQALLAALAQVARERSAWRILLNVQVDNAGAVSFYQTLGGTVFPNSRGCEFSGDALEKLATFKQATAEIGRES